MAADVNRGDLDALVSKMRSAAAPLRHTLQELHRAHAQERSGTVATYIPELAGAKPDWFGISLVTVEGMALDVGDWEQLFSIQSISKPFVFWLASAITAGSMSSRRSTSSRPARPSTRSCSTSPRIVRSTPWSTREPSPRPIS